MNNSPIKLTIREVEILKLIASDCSTNEIADKLFISKRTVETHRKNIGNKLNCKSKVALTKRAIQMGMLPNYIFKN